MCVRRHYYTILFLLDGEAESHQLLDDMYFDQTTTTSHLNKLRQRQENVCHFHVTEVFIQALDVVENYFFALKRGVLFILKN